MAEDDILSGAPECGLSIRIEPGYQFETLLGQLRDIFFIAKLSQYQRNMHILELPTAALTADMSEEMRGITFYAQKSGFVAIARGDAASAKDRAADGVLLEQITEIAPARALLGEEAIIGLRCGASRELAEQALQAGIDYVSFSAPHGGEILPPDIIVWWSALSDIPCLIEGRLNADNCGAYVRAGATFIDATDFIFHQPVDIKPVDIKQGTADMLFAIERALEIRRAT